VVLAGGPLWASSAMLLARSRLAGVLAGGLAVEGAVSGALLGLDPLDGGPDPLPVGPLGSVVRLRAERPQRVGDVVGVSVLLDLGRGVAPGPPAPGGGRHRAQHLQDITGAVGFDGYSGGAPPPGQGPHDLPILRTEVGVSF
jgi:hypothetical protein